ncbi:hypothetical protein WICPIJ_005355 [Wickerhamomyces pijperi]|uniref:Cell division cycle protein 123 n=1 Tax=Wickerhamomyces pijperi TaxID=599730 RepID=A0A9P8TLX1_WICPI|nr:hypothetical protein WICPIJ_005355 [Wickerhamomyces pijperi]
MTADTQETHKDHAVFQHIPVTRQQVLNCSFSSWYDKYKPHVPKSKIIKPLPSSFIHYLTSDGIVLPQEGPGSDNVGWSDDEEQENNEQIKELEIDESELESDSEEDQEPKKTFSELVSTFQETHDKIQSIIDQYGAVTPKLNWSAPRDATWITTTNTMKCTNVLDLYLLLNASNYVMYDIDSAFDECEDQNNGEANKHVEYELVLRKWVNVNPALEFRCFVKGRKLIGISQRELNYYDFLEALGSTLKPLIVDFFNNVLRDTFDDADFVFDVYIPRPFDKVFLIDINTFSRTTDSQMFTWHELALINAEEFDQEKDMEFRLVTKMNKGRFYSKEHSENQVPRDVVDASLDSNAMAELAKQWRELQVKAGVDPDA